jgi:hypothetical protein
MATEARLEIQNLDFSDSAETDDKDRLRIISCSFGFSQIEEKQKRRGYGAGYDIVTRVRAGHIKITIPTVRSPDLMNWMITRHLKHKGKITFIGLTNSGVKQEMESLEFEDALLVDLKEEFYEDKQMITHLTISSPRIKISNMEYKSETMYQSKYE